ncbi:hypothetical protein AKJ39_03065 [candidate division MSBL1 archaeon SCGC-AAA259J03]|uniref:Uncharacterized protein n=1 Tax=candidate division MSBL1 archaeon SCGC-AAA259J03 TaxID=1698269 RepID=A0A656YYT3_9EURY|nr:hypothetical protein AKJ39_03065 [candidate division MSBL1 archaeon SCGC-AAA259J03]
MSKAVKRIGSGKELQKVKETLQFHKQVLNEIRRKTLDKVNATISYAISNADRMKTVLDNIEPSKIRREGGIPDQAAEELKKVRQRTQKMKSLVKQAEKGEIPDRQAVQTVQQYSKKK